MSHFGRLGHSVTFLKSWAQCHVFGELGTMSHFGRVGHNVTFWKSWAQCHIFEQLGTVSQIYTVGFIVTNLVMGTMSHRHNVCKSVMYTLFSV